MFDLAYPLTETVEIDGKEYKIFVSFDNVLRLFDMLNDNELTYVTKVETGLLMLLGVELDVSFEKKAVVFNEIFEKVIAQGKEVEQTVDIEGNPMPSMQEAKEQVYSIKQDAELIYAGFLQDYGIDLFESQGILSWHKFRALLSALKKDTKFMEIIEIRTCDLPSGKGTSRQREHMKKLKKIYALKDKSDD